VISDYKPEIVQVNGARTVKYGAFAHLLSRDKTWTLIYRNIGNPEDWVKGVLRQLLYRKVVIPQINGVVGVSQKTLDNLLAFYSISLPSIHIPRGVDIDELRTPLSCQAIRQDLGVPEQAPVLLYIGSLSPEKRLDRLFRIVKQVQCSLPTLKLWIVGDGPLRPKLEKDVVSLGIAENVQFWGLQEDVGRYITAANLLLLTSDTEGLPGVVLEAGILGLPALSTRVGGTEECIRHGETGMLFDPDCENEFAQAVTLLLQDSSQRREMGQRAQAFIESRFSMSRIADQYTKFYERILSTRRTV
jgi:glycosyltransferase involved in cell wall biosynthesis